MKRRILLVDDELAILLTLKTILEIHGFDVETAASAKEAVSKLKANSYHMVITDMKMEHDKAGYEVIAFSNGKDAHERLKEEPFSLLLTDIVMPQMDGIELARRASELDPQLKIMFITGFAAVTLNTNSRAPKNARVLSKPFHLKDLVREIDRLLAM